MINKTRPATLAESQPLPKDLPLRLDYLKDIQNQFTKYVEDEISRLEADREFLESLAVSKLQLATRVPSDTLTELAATEYDRIRSEGVI